MTFLVIEDNPDIAHLLQRGFSECCYSADIAESGREGELAASRKTYEAIVLDRLLPDGDGVDVCKRLRNSGDKTPIIMLTGVSATEERVLGLDAGADDYVVKPFEFDELMARLRAVLRRGEATESTKLKYEEIEIDLARRSVTRAGKSIRLTNREFGLLEFFIRRKDRVLSRTTIGEQVWDMSFERDSNVIEVYVSMLRRKIDKGFAKPYLHTVVGSGYMFSCMGPTI